MTMAMATAMAPPELLLLPDTLAERLRAEDTRAAALQALDKLPTPCPPELALAAAPALVDVAAATEDREVLDRCGLLLARLLAEAPPDVRAVYGAALGVKRSRRWAPQSNPAVSGSVRIREEVISISKRNYAGIGFVTE